MITFDYRKITGWVLGGVRKGHDLAYVIYEWSLNEEILQQLVPWYLL